MQSLPAPRKKFSMVSQQRIRFFGWACLVGGALEIGSGILYLLLFGVQTSKWAPALDLLFLVANICLMGGPLGLLARRAFGEGAMGVLGKMGVVVTLLGLLSYIVWTIDHLLSPVQAFATGNFFVNLLPAGAGLSSLGMLLVGIATLTGRQLRGGQAFTPLLIPLAFLLNVVFQAVYFLLTGPHANPEASILLLCFGPMWVLVGYALQSSATATFTVASRA
jgi:hypothetical protein